MTKWEQYRKINLVLPDYNLKIEAPIILNPNKLHFINEELVYVNENTSEDIQVIVEAISVFFNKELDLASRPYEAGILDKHHAYLFVEKVQNERDHSKDEIGVRAIGGCSFHYEHENVLTLQWIWVHPFKRRKGIVSKHFDYFVNEYKEFGLSQIKSPIMRTFIPKGKDSWFYNEDTWKVQQR